jgi:actin-related protein
LVPTFVGVPKLIKLNQIHLPSASLKPNPQNDAYTFGLDCLTRSPLLSISPLIEQGVVMDWPRLEAFIEHTVLTYALSHQGTDLPIQRLLLSHSLPSKNSHKLAEIAFESLDCTEF